MWLGDFDPQKNVDFKFTTVDSTGLPTTLTAGSLQVYANNSATPIIIHGTTLSTNFNSITGLNHVRVALANNTTSYAAGNEFDVALGAGSVGTINVAGYQLAHFSVVNRSGAVTSIGGYKAIVGPDGLPSVNVVDISASSVSTTAIQLGVSCNSMASSASRSVVDELLDRNIAGGGSSGTRTIRTAFRSLRNKVNITAGTLTVYQEDDTTTDWTAAVTTSPGNPISDIDPV